MRKILVPLISVLLTMTASAAGLDTNRPYFTQTVGSERYCFYILDSGDEVSINSISSTLPYVTTERVVLPEEVTNEGKTYKVVEIEPEACSDNNWIWDLVYPSTLRKVGKKSFWHSELRSFKPQGESNLKEIDDMAFAASKVWDIDLGNKIEKIGNKAFAGFQFKYVRIPNSVTTLGQEAFSGNIVEDVTIGDGLTYICGGAFSNNPALRNVNIGKSVKTIDYNAFKGCNLQELVIPDNVKTLGEDAFAGNKYLKSVKLSSSLENIPNGCFSECGYISDLKIPANVTAIGTGAFYLCTGLVKLEFEEGSRLTSIGVNAFAGNRLAQLKMPDTVEEIGTSAFLGSGSLVSVHFSSGLKTIGYRAFSACKEIRDVTCYAAAPPVTTVDCFETNVYDNARLWVDEDALKLFKRDEVWRLFRNIEGVEGASIEAIGVDSETSPVLYDLSGRRLGDAEAADPSRGIYIEKSGKRTRKIIVTK